MRATAVLIAALAFVLPSETSASTTSSYNWERMVRSCEAPGPDTRWWEGGWWANTGNGFYFGPQFVYSTWRRHGGPRLREVEPYARDARRMRTFSKAFIIRIAENTMKAEGPQAWPNCHQFL